MSTWLFSLVGVARDLRPVRAGLRRGIDACAGSFGALLLGGCVEPLAEVTVDASEHDLCSAVQPHVVDASASEIQCLAEDYVYVSYAMPEEYATNVPGPPVCCEVCATAGRHAVILRADDVHRSRGIAAKWVDIRPSGT